MIESKQSFYVPESLAELGNRKLRDILLEAFAEKGNNQVFIKDGQQIVFPESPYSSGRLADYKNKLIEWAEDPNFPQDNIEALGLEILIKLMLREALKKEKDIIVFQSPATMDFTDRKDFMEWGPTSDIVIGRKLPEGIEPIALISTKMVSHQSMKKNNKLGVPIINISAHRLFNRKEQFYINFFAADPRPANFAFDLAQRSPLIEKLATVTKSLNLHS